MSNNFQGRTMQEYLSGNKCSTTYENSPFCAFDANCWLYRRIKSIHQPRQLWSRISEMILTGPANTAEELVSGGFMSSIGLQATLTFPKAGAHFLPAHQPERPLHLSSFSEVSRAEVPCAQRKRAPGLSSLSAGTARAAFPYFQCLPHGRCNWCFSLIWAWCQVSYRHQRFVELNRNA